ncbi:hypothetical protein ACS0TY_005710 [Phlomoides rotata]
MDSLALVIVLVVLVLASFNVLVRSGQRKLPPGPYPFPIIGNIHQLGSNPHRSIANLSKTYGPLLSLHLGSLYTVVASSPEVARQVLQQHDHALCSRAVIATAEALNFHKNSFSFLPVGSRKKALKIYREHLFSTPRLDESHNLRLKKLTKLRNYLHECTVARRVVNVGEAVFTTALNLMTAILFSVELASFDLDIAQELKETVEGVMKTWGTQNLADFFPLIKPFDPQEIKRQSGIYLWTMINMCGDIINKRLKSRSTSVDSLKKYDLLETLLSLRGERDANLRINDITHLFMELFMAQTHTTTSTVEWVMTELIINPAKMDNAKNELRSLIGKNEQVAESDISRLPYMKAVIKETLRLHPPSPLLATRKADSEVEINGYTIPKNTQVFVNVWEIGRDSSIWPNPTSFEPERFFNNEIDYKGKDFELLPFGSGRRMCPGISLADRMLPLMVASFIHNFNWKLEPGVKPQDVDTTDKFGIAACKAVPLMAIPIEVLQNYTSKSTQYSTFHKLYAHTKKKIIFYLFFRFFSNFLFIFSDFLIFYLIIFKDFF